VADQLTIRGLLVESALPELLRSVCRSKESAILTCYVNEQKKSVYVQEGQIIFASSSDFDDRLGESLLRHGKISIRNFLDATKSVRPENRLGSILCDSNAITPEELVDGVRRQVRGIIISLFSAVHGRYELALKEIDTQEMIILNESSENIIYQGVKSIESWSRISKGIGSYNNILKCSEDSDKILYDLTLPPEESHLVSLCSKGQFNVEEICGMSYLNNFETCRILWAMLIVGALQAVEVPAEVPSDTATSMDAESDLHDLVENYNDLYSHIYEYALVRLGDQADELAGRAMHQVQDALPDVTRDLRLDTYGRLDFDSILRNLAPIPETGRVDLVTGALEEIVYALLCEVGTYFGPDDQTRLAEEIRKLRK
jgi:Domain of unknown function (DUF4388)